MRRLTADNIWAAPKPLRPAVGGSWKGRGGEGSTGGPGEEGTTTEPLRIRLAAEPQNPLLFGSQLRGDGRRAASGSGALLILFLILEAVLVEEQVSERHWSGC